MQLFAVSFIPQPGYSTCFGRFTHPYIRSTILTVSAASGTNQYQAKLGEGS